MRTLCVGDIHGNFRALVQVLERSNFDFKKDRLISLGDIYDGHSGVVNCIDVLMDVKHFIWVLGNHDEFVRRWFRGKWDGDPQWEARWLRKGGKATKKAYTKNGKLKKKLIKKHLEFLEKAVLYFIDEDNRLYVHAGIDWDYPVDKQPEEKNYYAGRDTWRVVAPKLKKAKKKFPYKNVFIGHTHTELDFPGGKPVKVANLWNLDQGAGWDGKLTIMDVNTFKYWQSD
ncbi:MAG: metallophosphoesterase [Thermodesulfobacteriota bacterium]